MKNKTNFPLPSAISEKLYYNAASYLGTVLNHMPPQSYEQAGNRATVPTEERQARALLSTDRILDPPIQMVEQKPHTQPPSFFALLAEKSVQKTLSIPKNTSLQGTRDKVWPSKITRAEK